jgi:lysophosphatidylcholine acyltransferase/lyso-PAF acetyltransferase
MGVAVCVLSILGERMDEENPHPQRSWRRFLTNTIGGYLSRLLLFGMGFQWIRVRGSPASTADAPLWVVSPHSCILDMIVVSMFHLPTYVAKREVRSTPLFGHLITHTLRTIYVARDDPSSRKQCTAEIVRRSQNREAGWPKVMLFPEATTHSNEVLLQFKKGAFLPGLPVQAVAIKYRNRVNSMVWGDRGLNILTSLYLTLCQFHNYLEVEFLPVHRPSPDEIDSPELFAENVRAEVSQATGIPTSSYSVEDMLLCRSAEKLGLPYRSGLVSYPTVQRELRLSVSDIKYWLRRFSSMDRDRDGFITADDLLHYLAVPSDACTLALFSALAEGTEGKLSFRRYLHGVMGLSLPFISDESLRAVFQYFVTENAEQVTLADISSRLPVQWSSQSDASNPRGSPPPRQRGCDMYGCRRGRKLRRRGGQPPQLASLPATMDYGQFCSAMLANREYLLLFHECQGAVLSSPAPPPHHDDSTPPTSLPRHSNTSPIQLVAVTIET